MISLSFHHGSEKSACVDQSIDGWMDGWIDGWMYHRCWTTRRGSSARLSLLIRGGRRCVSTRNS